MTLQLTTDIESLRVTATNPPSSAHGTDDCYGKVERMFEDHVDSPRSGANERDCVSRKGGMDFERCSALHDAIVRHGWVGRGHDLSDLPNRTYWERWRPTLTPYQSERLQDRLHPTVLAFLQSALELPDFYPGSFMPPNFFYHLVGLCAPLELFANHEEVEGDRYVTLYCLQGALATEGKMPDGLVYDQLQHRCVLIKDVDEGPTLDLDEQDLNWQPLEMVLTEYCEMIEANKVVALPKTVKGPEPFEYVRNPAGGYAMREIPDDELRDPRTGARRTRKSFDPWTMVPFTERDVELAVQAWNRLVGVIEERIPSRGPSKQESRETLYSFKIMQRAGLRRDGFAFSFLGRATKPSFSNLAPGLQLLSEEDFVRQPFQDVTLKRPCSTPPVLLLRGSQALSAISGEYEPETGEEVPAGLYLERCDPDTAFPLENAVRVTSPFRRTGNWDVARALLPVEKPHLFAYGILLHVILNRFAELVETGQWSVRNDGVEGDIFELCDS